MWFWFSVIALLFWSGSDLFSKIGCRDADDKYAHLKMVMAVGVVMGLHAAFRKSSTVLFNFYRSFTISSIFFATIIASYLSVKTTPAS